MRRFVLFPVFYLASLVFIIMGCSAEAPLELESPTSVPVAAAPEAENVATEDIIAQISEEVVFPRPSYMSVGRRDPFRSIIAASAKRPKIVDALPPLQRSELSDLTLQGIVWGSYGPRAIVNTPDGKGYTVGVGTKMGFNHGVISEITQKKVVVEETVLNVFGEPKKRKTEMELHPRKEG